jgi:hypothetical protein
MSYESSIQITKLINQGCSENYEHGWIRKSNLFEDLIPRVYRKPNLIQTFLKLCNAETHFIISENDLRNVCSISTENIAKMLNLPLGNSPILELDLLKRVEGWPMDKRNTVIQNYTIYPKYTFKEFLIRA